MKRPEMKPMKYVKKCETCHGTGQVWGVVQFIWCDVCIGERYRSATNGPVSTKELSDELHDTRMALAAAIDHLNSMPLSTGGESPRYVSNSRGPGGSNFTGD